MNNELISVIVPIYNVEKYIGKCVDSLINQTYKNIEIILVDDGSPDKCGAICDKYAVQDKRIKVIHKKNGGLSDARNYGIDVAKGDYILLIDSDDYVNLEIVEFLYNDLKKNNADISTCLPITFYEDSENILDNSQNYNIVLDTEQALENLMYTKDVTVNAWGKLYKKKLFDNVRYPKGKLYEDVATAYLLFANTKKVSINTKKMYYYRVRKGSIIKSKFKKERMDSLYFAEEETKYIKENYPSIINAALNKEFMEAVFISKEIPLNKEFSCEIKKLSHTLKKYRKTIIEDPKATKNAKINAIISFFGVIGIQYSTKFYRLFGGRIIK